MARPLRIEYEGAIYHVIQRGIERKPIFKHDKDKEKFLLYLVLAYKAYKIIIHSYILMNNHYHLILETPCANLSKIMHYLNTSYAAYFNSKYKRVGPLYQGRYKSILVEKDEYMHILSRYIHLNPVRINIVGDPLSYRWSSYKYFVSNKTPQEGVDISFILSMFDKDIRKAKKSYKNFLLDGIGKEREEIRENTRKSFLLGGDEFFKEIKERFIDKRKDSEIPLLREIKRESDESIKHIINDLVKRRPEKSDKLKRKVSIYLIRKYTQETIRNIAKSYGKIKYTTVSKICSRIDKERLTDNKLNKILVEFEDMVEKMSNVKT